LVAPSPIKRALGGEAGLQEGSHRVNYERGFRLQAGSVD
jgi:hypothetical protein